MELCSEAELSRLVSILASFTVQLHCGLVQDGSVSSECCNNVIKVVTVFGKRKKYNSIMTSK